MATVLVIEDDPDMREIERTALSCGGHEVVLAHNGSEGLRALEERRPCIILLDLMMPDVSGGRMYDEMMQHPATAGIPIIVVTGKPDAHEIFDDQIGPDNVIMKPFEAETLLGRIRQHIGDPE